MFALKYQAPLPQPSRADGTALPALLSALLAVMVLLQFALPPAEDPIFVPGRAATPQLTAEGLSLSLADPVILRSALFAPGRARGQTSAAGTGPLDGARFVGVVRGRGFARAVLQTAEGEAASVSVGTSYHGWRLISLRNDNAVFIRDGIRHTAIIGRGANAPASSFQSRFSNEQ
jgi:hypothetical protein